MRVTGPDDTHYVGTDTGHRETEEDTGQDELVATATVDLKNSHVQGGADSEEEDENGADGDVDGGGGKATELGIARCIWRALLVEKGECK